MGCKRGGSTTYMGGIMEVPMLDFDVGLGLVPKCVVLVLGIEGMGPHHMQGRHMWGLGLGVGLRKLVF